VLAQSRQERAIIPLCNRFSAAAALPFLSLVALPVPSLWLGLDRAQAVRLQPRAAVEESFFVTVLNAS